MTETLRAVVSVRILSCLMAALGFFALEAEGADRSREGLQVLYDFQSTQGNIVKDRSGVGQPLDLTISNPKAVRRTAGGLDVTGPVLIQSAKPASKVIQSVRQTREITLEAWIEPANTRQSGPARIMTLSRDSSARNFTLGQDGDKMDIRFRSTKTSGNGLPSLASGSRTVPPKLIHVVYTKDRSGKARLYINGQSRGERTVAGDLSNWDQSYHLALANELSKDRPWLGKFHLVAIYNRDLSLSEVRQHFAVGVKGQTQAPTVVADSATSGNPPDARVHQGLLALYNFMSASGSMVHDRSGVGQPLDLRITNIKTVRRSEGSLRINGDTLIRSDKPARKLIQAIRRSGEITLEAWIQPANLRQDGPARIVTLSKNSTERNFTIGQEKDRLQIRYRTSQTTGNGIPSTDTPGQSLGTKLTHVVYTRNRSGICRIYLNGKQRAQKKVDGNLSNWGDGFQLALGNELTGGRPWQGTFHLVAIFNRDLTAEEVVRNFRSGARGTGPSGVLVESGPSAKDQFFYEHIAPMLSQHCLECHDSATRKGKLDLSRKSAALAGGKGGAVLVPGKPEESSLWESVEADDMPDERPPLSADEKKVLRAWIESGAAWPKEQIDPADYVNDQRKAENWVQRLTLSEYINTVRATLGVDISSEAQEILPPDLRADGFGNTAYNLNVDLKHVDAYAQLAEKIVAKMDVKEFASRYSKNRRLTDDNMRGLISRMGKWILRGPMEEHEVVTYRGISTTVASAGGDFEMAVGLILEAMLQSPRFIYRVESHLGDGTPWPVGEYELASRLSYIIWGSSPDANLLKAAEDGELSDPQVLAAQVTRMLEDPRAVDRSAEFIHQWLNLNSLSNLKPNSGKFPRWKPELALDMKQETLAFFKEVVWKQERPLNDLLNAKVTFVTPRLARHYGMKPQEGKGMARYDLKNVRGRGGLLTQGSMLTIGGDEASMVTRGLFVLHDLLRGLVKDPPPCIDTTPIPSKPGLSQRAIAMQRIQNPACGGCHAKFEPLAFGLEKFDGLGTYHDKDEHGNQLREDGEMLVPGDAEPVRFQTSSQLMDLLAKSERVGKSMTRKLAQFTLGRPLVGADAPVLDAIHDTAQKNGGTYQSLITAIVMSDLVQMTRTETSP